MSVLMPFLLHVVAVSLLVRGLRLITSTTTRPASGFPSALVVPGDLPQTNLAQLAEQLLAASGAGKHHPHGSSPLHP